MDRLKLKWKIFVYLLGFCALLLVMLWFFQTVFLYDMYKAIRGQELESAMSYVQDNINDPRLFTILEELRADKEITVTLAPGYIPPQETKIQDLWGNLIQETVTKTKEFILSDGSALYLTFHAIISPVDATVTTLRLQLYIVTAVMVVLSVALAAIISRRVSRPLEDINRSAGILATGNYGVSFEGKGFLEIKELSDTLNTAARELSKVDGLRRELMANVSHDMRTPLSLIYGYAEMLHDFPREITHQNTQMIMDETRRLTSLVNDVMDTAKLESGMQELNRAGFCLTALIREKTERMVGLMEGKGVDISFDCDGNYHVFADELKIDRAYNNILSNAINYGGSGGRVEVRQTVSHGKVRIEVIDNGDGISPEELPYIWDRYYTSTRNHKRAVMGSGLGLSIVRRIFEMHGAEYGVTSEVGKGSCFWFALDIYDPAGRE